jgi:hypothetical protein
VQQQYDSRDSKRGELLLKIVKIREEARLPCGHDCEPWGRW